ncbi:MAG: carbohydrate-binding family 9-like protein, partial [Myxococcota bacterium]
MVWTAQTLPGQQDGRDHLLAARFSVEGRTKPVDDLPVARIVRTDSPIVPDGELDEPGWKRAPVLEFADSMGRNIVIRHKTRLRLLYDDQNLYVAFEADDTDITERYKNRDDPIYEHETVELFVMPNVTAPNTGPYVELQASPTGVIFDASFDGPRRGMNKRYGAGQKVGTAVDGTLNDERPDRGWVSEWVVPFKNIRGVQKPPAAGTEWRMNAFRIEKYRRGGRQIGEFSAWSPPRVGDFHHVARFGRMRFEGPPSP